MFWIPIAAIVIAIWLIVGAVRGVKDASYEASFSQKRQSEQQLAGSVLDPALESELSYNLGGQRDVCRQIVRSFMGGGEEWDEYADLLSGKQKAVLVRMAQRGRLPRDFTGGYGANLPLGNTALHPDPKRTGLEPTRGVVMNEEFILRIEEQLQSCGLDAVVMVSTSRYNGKDTEMCDLPLRDYLGRFGSGSTNYSSRFRFVSEETTILRTR